MYRILFYIFVKCLNVPYTIHHTPRAYLQKCKKMLLCFSSKIVLPPSPSPPSTPTTGSFNAPFILGHYYYNTAWCVGCFKWEKITVPLPVTNRICSIIYYFVFKLFFFVCLLDTLDPKDKRHLLSSGCKPNNNQKMMLFHYFNYNIEIIYLLIYIIGQVSTKFLF